MNACVSAFLSRGGVCVCGYMCARVCVLSESADAYSSASAQFHAQISAKTFGSVQMVRSVCVYVSVCVGVGA